MCRWIKLYPMGKYLVMCRTHDSDVGERYTVEAVTETLEEAQDQTEYLVLLRTDEMDDPVEMWDHNADEDHIFIRQFSPIYALKPQKDSVYTAFVVGIAQE